MTTSLKFAAAALATALASGCATVEGLKSDAGTGYNAVKNAVTGGNQAPQQQAPVAVQQAPAPVAQADTSAAASGARDCVTLAEAKTPQVLGSVAFVQNAHIGCKFARVASGEYAPTQLYQLTDSRQATAYARDFEGANRLYQAALRRQDSQEARDARANNPIRILRGAASDISSGVGSVRRMDRSIDQLRNILR